MPVSTDELRVDLDLTGATAFAKGAAEAAAMTALLGMQSQKTAGGMALVTVNAVAEALGLGTLASAEAMAAAASAALAAGEGLAAAAAAALDVALTPVTVIVVALAADMIVLTAGMAALAAEAAVIGAALGLGAAGAKASEEAYREWEAVMKDVELQSGATKEAMASLEAATLSEDMVKLGVNATEAAKGYQILASMGYSAADMQTAMLPITQTAIALGIEQADATRLMIALMKQYNLTIADMPMIADMLVGGLNKTAMQGDQVAEVMRYAGVAASSLGWSLGETIAAVDPLVAAFGNAEMAGTGFRGVLDRLKAPSAETAGAFKKAGLNVNDFAKHSGSAAELITWLKSGMWDAQTVARAFGAEAANAAQTLMRVDVPALQKTADAIGEMGSAQDYARGKMETMEGQLAQLGAAFQDLKIQLGGVVSDFTGPYVRALLIAVNALNNFVNKSRDAARKFQEDEKAKRLASGETADAIKKDLDDKVAKSLQDAIDKAEDMAVGFVKAVFSLADAVTAVSPALALQANLLLMWVQGAAQARLGAAELALAWANLRDDLWPSRENRAQAAAAKAAYNAAREAVQGVKALRKGLWDYAWGPEPGETRKKLRTWRDGVLKEIGGAADAVGAAADGSLWPKAGRGGMPPLAGSEEADREQVAADRKVLANRYAMLKAAAREEGQKAKLELQYRWEDIGLLRRPRAGGFNLEDMDEVHKAEIALTQAQVAAGEAGLSEFLAGMAQRRAAIKQNADYAKAATEDEATRAGIEYDATSDIVELLYQEQAALQGLNLTKAEQRRIDNEVAAAETAQMQAYMALQKAYSKDLQEVADKRTKGVKDQADKMHKAVQLVIGGRLGEGIQDAIKRLGGGGLKNATAEVRPGEREIRDAVNSLGTYLLAIDDSINHLGGPKPGKVSNVTVYGPTSQARVPAPPPAPATPEPYSGLPDYMRTADWFRQHMPETPVPAAFPQLPEEPAAMPTPDMFMPPLVAPAIPPLQTLAAPAIPPVEMLAPLAPPVPPVSDYMGPRDMRFAGIGVGRRTITLQLEVPPGVEEGIVDTVMDKLVTVVGEAVRKQPALGRV